MLEGSYVGYLQTSIRISYVSEEETKWENEGGGCANGCLQQEYITKGESSSPTVLCHYTFSWILVLWMH